MYLFEPEELERVAALRLHEADKRRHREARRCASGTLNDAEIRRLTRRTDVELKAAEKARNRLRKRAAKLLAQELAEVNDDGDAVDVLATVSYVPAAARLPEDTSLNRRRPLSDRIMGKVEEADFFAKLYGGAGMYSMYNGADDVRPFRPVVIRGETAEPLGVADDTDREDHTFAALADDEDAQRFMSCAHPGELALD